MGQCQMSPDWDAYYQDEEASQSCIDPTQYFGCTPSSPAPYGNQAFLEDVVGQQSSDESDSSDQYDPSMAAAAGAMRPPGNCTRQQWYDLQQVVKQECKINMPRACTEDDSPEELEDKADHFQRCIDARTELADTCFDGGDAGHREQIDNLTTGRENCEELRDPAPVPVPVPLVDPVTEVDPVPELTPELAPELVPELAPELAPELVPELVPEAVEGGSLLLEILEGAAILAL